MGFQAQLSLTEVNPTWKSPNPDIVAAAACQRGTGTRQYFAFLLVNGSGPKPPKQTNVDLEQECGFDYAGRREIRIRVGPFSRAWIDVSRNRSKAVFADEIDE